MLSSVHNTPSRALATLVLAFVVLAAFVSIILATSSNNWLTWAYSLPVALAGLVFAFLAYRR